MRTYTQEDPIGLAGGPNLYGFANGDPINFSDPYGLCPTADGEDDRKPCELGDIEQAHGFWLDLAREGVEEGGILDTDVAAGDTIGTLQSLQERYPGIPNHVEVRVWLASVLTDPSTLIPTGCP